MSFLFQENDQQSAEDEQVQRAKDLLNQQVWCWGQDILRPEGNWLLDVGFSRIEPPADRENSSSVYELDLPGERRVILRGFGVFFGDREHGSIFLPRYRFQPEYSTHATLERPPWSEADLPRLSDPNESNRAACITLMLALFDWIRSYEVTIVERLGLEYRKSTLLTWDNGKRSVIPAGEMANAWRQVGVLIAEDPRLVLPHDGASDGGPDE